MQRRYFELIELARVCSRQAQTTQTEQVARMLRRMARQYLQEAAKLDGGKVPDIGLICLKQARQGHANLPRSSRMVAFVYRCPSTSLRVQGWVADDPSERDGKSYEAVTCLICARIHLVNPKTGKVLLGEGDDGQSADRRRPDASPQQILGATTWRRRRDDEVREGLRAASADARCAVMRARVALAEAIKVLEVPKKIERALSAPQIERPPTSAAPQADRAPAPAPP
jgi:hypothetical protein